MLSKNRKNVEKQAINSSGGHGILLHTPGLGVASTDFFSRASPFFLGGRKNTFPFWRAGERKKNTSTKFRPVVRKKVGWRILVLTDFNNPQWSMMIYESCSKAMACHKGSVFGALGEELQPSSEQLRRCKMRKSRWVVMEKVDLSQLMYCWNYVSGLALSLFHLGDVFFFSLFFFWFLSFLYTSFIYFAFEQIASMIESILVGLDRLSNFPQMAGVDVKNWIASSQSF